MQCMGSMCRHDVGGADAVCDQKLQHASQNVSTFLWKVLTQCVIRGCSTRRKMCAFFLMQQTSLHSDPPTPNKI